MKFHTFEYLFHWIMIRIKQLFLTASLIGLFSSFCQAQVSVSRVEKPDSFQGKEGVFYYLPATFLEFTIAFDRVEELRGPYADYAYQYLGLDDVIREDREFYELKDIRLFPHVYADPDQHFFIEFLQKQTKDPLPVELLFDEQGFLSELAIGMELSGQPEPGPLVMQLPEPAAKYPHKPDPFQYYATDNQVLRIDTIIRVVSIDTSTFTDISYTSNMVYRTVEERAMEAASFIMRIREDRFKLLTGYQEVNYDKEAIAYMDRELMELEDAYLSLFKGVRRRECHLATRVLVPNPGRSGRPEVLCRFSAASGIGSPDDPQGDPVSVVIAPVGISPESTYKGTTPQPGSAQGIAIRLPQMCQVTVDYLGIQKTNRVLPVHQFGYLSHFTYTSKLRLQLHPATGLVRQIIVQ